MHVADEAPRNGEHFIREVQWTGQPKPKHAREYVRWCHAVNTHLADLWNIRLMHVVQTLPNSCEFWAYEPDQPPKLMQTIHDSPNAST